MDDFEEFEELEEEGMEVEEFYDVEPEMPGPRVPPGPPVRAAPRAPERRPPPGPPRERAGPMPPPEKYTGPARQAPAPKPAPMAKPEKPVNWLEKREQSMGKITMYLLLLGFIDIVLSFVAGLRLLGGWLGLAIHLANLVALIVIGSHASRIGARARDTVCQNEQRNINRFNIGILLILTVPLYEVWGIWRVGEGFVDPGYYGGEWCIVNWVIIFAGVLFMVRGLYLARERLTYYKVWNLGIWLLLLAPLHGIIHHFTFEMGALVFPYFFMESVVMVAAVVIAVAFGMKGYLSLQFKELEEATNRGNALIEQGRYRAAIEEFDRAIEIGHNLYSQYFYDALTARQAQRLPAQYGIPWLRKGDAVAQLGRSRKAVAIYDIILELDPTNEVVWNRRGEVLVKMGRYKDALQCFDNALKYMPTYVRASENKEKVKQLLQRGEVEVIKE
jgi:hypothetical protein